MNQFQHKMIVKAHFIGYFVSKQSFAGTRIQTYDLPTSCQDIAFLAGISISPIVHFASIGRRGDPTEVTKTTTTTKMFPHLCNFYSFAKHL